MSGRHRTVQRPSLPTLDEIIGIVAPFGVSRVGVASADVLAATRSTLIERKAAGLNDTMEFTYRNPERSTDPQRAVEGAESVIVGARPYLTDADPPEPDPTRPHARVGRYAWENHYEPLRQGLREVAVRIKAAGHRAVVFADDNAIVDRAVAHRAGIGWFGKNANLLLPGAGSFFVLGSIITTAEYEPNPTPAPDGCGTCTRCIELCPTQAIVAPGVIDAAKCLSWVMQKGGSIPERYRIAMHDRIYGCDDCQDVCPISTRLGQRNTVPLSPQVQAWVDALELLDADDDWIARHYGHWYIAGREMRWLRRNALVVLGNVAQPADARVRATLDRYRLGDDPILAEHARWADQRLDDRRDVATANP
ncbi:MAG: tRNA epoxyqueuosine(34) reductase QueG [Ilumatobacter sp.]|uniref:tRNA epoxyqueuosine(34) reductase QueG n=1 Tax=Ilumatobacter sp. TaxID=1967498 RepID=UPI00391C8A1E